MGTEPIFIRSIPKKDHRRLWTLCGTERVKLKLAKYRLHVKIYLSRSIFFARVNGPLGNEIISYSQLQSPHT